MREKPASEPACAERSGIALEERSGSETVSLEDLRMLAAGSKPCITVALAIPNPTEIEARIKHTIRHLEKLLNDKGIDADLGRVLLEPIHGLADHIVTNGVWSKALIFFRSSGIFRSFLIRDLHSEFITVGDRFQVRPLLPLLCTNQQFYLLAIGQKDVRLFCCTHHSAKELDLRGLAPQNFAEWLNNDKPDHVLENRLSGLRLGDAKGVLSTTNTDELKKDEWLLHFFKQIDKGIHKLLRHETAPLVIAGVESEIALYRKVNSYTGLLDEAIYGSASGLTAQTLHERAVEIVQKIPSVPLKRALNNFEELRGSDRVSVNLNDILMAAWEGRVSDLLLREDAEYRGVVDESCQSIQGGSDASQEPEDLLNFAAVHTLLHRGQAFGLKTSDMPDGLEAAAILRFAI